MNLSTIKSGAIKAVYAGRALIGKHGPAIMTGVGIVGVLVGTTMACKASLKVNDLFKEDEEDLNKVHNAAIELKESEYSTEDFQLDLAKIYGRRIGKLIRLFGPAIIVETLSIASIVGGYKILSARNVALGAAYKLIATGFKTYRQRVVKDLGDEKDREYRFGILNEDVQAVKIDDVTGKKKKVTERRLLSTEEPSDYARYFTDKNPEWRHDEIHRMHFLRTQQKFANDLLNIRGHVFLNEVYDLLGFDRTPAGQVVGWVKDNPAGDGSIDFRIWAKGTDMLVNQENPMTAIFMDFNVDGVVYNLI